MCFRMTQMGGLFIALAAQSLASSAHADPTLRLRKLPGPGITIAVSLEDLASPPAAGYQVFLEFDDSHMAFVAGAYVTDRFGLGIVNPITAASGQMTLAAGVNVFTSQPPVTADSDLAYLVFQPLGTGCEPRIRMRTSANPPTRVTDSSGFAIEPLTLIDAWNPCPQDFNENGLVSVQDIFDFLAAYFGNDCRADFNNTNGISVQDIFDFLAAYFTGPC